MSAASGNSAFSASEFPRRDGGAGMDDVSECAAGVADGGEDLLDAALAVVFDEKAGGGGDIGLEIGVDPARIADFYVETRVVQPSCERPAFDKEVQLEAGPQHVVERANDEFVLTDANDAHVRRTPRGPGPQTAP